VAVLVSQNCAAFILKLYIRPSFDSRYAEKKKNRRPRAYQGRSKQRSASQLPNETSHDQLTCCIRN